MNASEKTAPRTVDWLGIVAPIVAGLVAGLAYADDRLAWLAWIALVPLGLVWTRRNSASIPLTAAFVGGFLYHGLALSWLRTCYAEPGQWFGPRTAAWLAISVVAAAFFAAMCRYGQYLVRAVRMPATLALPLAWVSIEFAKQFAGLVFSQVEFPWAKLGLTQASWLTLAQTADLGGEPLLSFLVCLANGALADALALLRATPTLSRRRLAGGAVCGALLLAAAWSYGRWRTSQTAGHPGPVVCLMGELDLPPFFDASRIPAQQTNRQRPQVLLWSELAWHHKLVDATSVDGAWPDDTPEDVTLVAHGDVPTYGRFVRRSLFDAAHDVDAVLVMGCERLKKSDDTWQRFNSVVCVDPATDSIECYDKQWLVPFGEFVPYTEAGARDIDTMYWPGTAPPLLSVSGRPQTYRFRAAICYDICFAAHFRPGAGAGDAEQADFFVHCGSEGQDPSGALARLLLYATKLRAIESRRAIVRNVDHGDSGLVDSCGATTLVTHGQPVHTPTLLPPVPIDQRMSLYTLWGDGPLLVLCAATATWAWWRRKNPESVSRNE